MRKRQFKKVLSLVLALAMVFSMNTSVFATGTVDAPVVETQTETQPENPVTNETETPAAEEPAPATEPAPAADPEPVVKGTTPTGIEVTADSESDYSWDGTTITVGSGKTVGIGRTSGEESDAGLAVTVDGDGSAYLAEGTVNLSATPIVEGSGKTVPLTGTASLALKSGAANADAIVNDDELAKLNIETGYSVYAYSEGSYTAKSSTEVQALDAVTAGSYYAVKENTLYKVNAIDKLTAQDKPVTTGITVAVNEEKTEATITDAGDHEYYLATSDTNVPARSSAASATVTAKKFTVAAGNTYYLYARLAADATHYSSDWSDAIVTNVPAPEPEPGKWYETVSGYNFSIPDDSKATITSENKANKTATVKIAGGEVKVAWVAAGGAEKKALSVDIAEGATLVFDSDDGEGKKIDEYNLLSLTGSGTVLLNAMDTSSAVFPNAFESVDSTLSLSGNNASILLSANNAGTPEYIPVANGKDAAANIKGGKLAVATLTPGTAGVDATNYIMSETGALQLLSANKTDFTSVANKGLIKASENRIEGVSVKYGETIIYATDADTLAGAGVMTIPNQSSNLWTPHIVTGMGTSNGVNVSYDTDQTILVDEDGNTKGDGAKKNKYKWYEFTISSSDAAISEAEKASSDKWTDANSNANITTTTTGAAIESGKDYWLYARRKATSKEYKSKVIRVGKFTTLKNVTISINLANASLSPNYIGYDANFEEIAKRTDVINRNFFDFVPHNFNGAVTFVDGYVLRNENGSIKYQDTYNDNNYTVLDSDGFVLGYVTVVFGTYKNDHSAVESWTAGNFYSLPAANDGKEKHYAAKVKFTALPDIAQTVYNDQTSEDDSGVVSFNVIKAPTKIEPVVTSPAVSGNVAAPGFKVTSTITGRGVTVTDSGLDHFYIDGKKADSTSWNKLKAGTYKITVSGEGLTSGNYEVSKEGGKADYSTEVTLKVVDKDSSEGLKVNASKLANSHVYYGTNFAGLKSALSVNYTFGGETLEWTSAIQKTANAELVVLNSASSNAQKAPASMILANKEIDKLATVSGGTTVYAYYVNAPYQINTTKMVASSNAVEVKIEPRPVKVTIPDNANALKTKRGSDLISKISSNKLKVEIANADGNYAASGAKDVPAATGVTGDKFFAGKEINLNTSTVDKNVPGSFATTKDKYTLNDNINIKNAYAAFLTGYTISSNYAQNYVINKSDYINEGDKLDYEVEARYYISYILEYGGQGAKTGQRHVSTNVIDDVVYNGVYNVNPSGTAKITESWNIAGFKLPETDKIVNWEIKRADTLANVVASIPYAGNANVTLTTYDIAVYAVVAARATKEGVMAKSITPVNYYGMAHVEQQDGTTTKIGDLNVELYDEGKTVTITPGVDPVPAGYTWLKNTTDGKAIYAYNLVKGTDYTLSYKNNINASVAYDETVSGENNVKRIVDDKKMPQVIVKGKNNYKSLKTTILFDILPTTYNASLTEALTYQLAGKNLNTKADVTKVLPKKLRRTGSGYYDNGGTRESTKTYKLRAGKLNASKGTYTGDYIMNVYRQETTGERTLLGEAKDLKKIPAGTYVLQFKGVNNYRGTNEVTINVKNWTLLSQQKFKWTKKVPWDEKITVANFKIEVTNKKTKAPITLVKAADEATQAGYYINSIHNDTRSYYLAVPAGGDLSEANFDDAGTYTINLKASTKLMETADIAGTHSLKVTVAGTKLKTSDFTINNTKANKTVIIDYDGKPTEKPVEVKIANGKLTVDAKNKIPVALGSEKRQAANGDTALGTYTSTFNNGKARYLKSDGTYKDSGATYTATLSRKGVYTLSPVANNSSIYEEYAITINPSGKYYGPNADGTITLKYKRGNIDLKKAIGTLVKITEVPVEVNVGGTNADLRIEIAGMNVTKEVYEASPDDYSVAMSGNTVITTADGKVLMAPYADSVGKQHVLFDGEDIFDITYTGNKKVGKGKATIKPSKYGKSFFKGSAPVDFTIKQRTVNEVLSMDAITTAKAGDIIAEVNDAVAPKSGSPKVNAKLYQVAEFGGKLTKLNAKDATITAGTEVKSKGFPIVVTAGSSGNFKFVNAKKETKVEATDTYFNVFGKKGKIKVTLSDGNAPGCVYDSAKKGYLYTGDKVDPKVTKIEIDGTTYTFPAGVSTSSNFTVKYENDVKVGNATATITLKRNPKAVSGNEYPVGGSVKVKYKIIPHNNNDLILSK